MDIKFLLLAFLLFSATFATETETETSNPYLYIKSISPDKDELHTRPYFWFESTVRLSTTAEVISYAGGTATDLGNGAVICEGSVTAYGSSRGEWAHGGLYAYSPWTWDEDCTDPNTAQSTISAQAIDWDDADYGTFAGLQQCTGTMSCWGKSGTLHAERVDTYEDLEGGTIWSYKRGNMNTICAGDQSLRYAFSSPFSLVTFIHTGEPGSTHSGAVTLSKGSYTFTNALSVDGCAHIIREYPECNDREHIYSRTEAVAIPDPEEYSNDLPVSIGVTVVDAEDVGVIPPNITSVTLEGHTMTSGHYTLEPGEDIPATITVRIPARTSQYDYYLTFELDQAQALTPFTYDPTSGLHQCGSMLTIGKLKNGGWGASNSAYDVHVEGTLHVPDTLPDEGGDLAFRVHWQSCSGQPDCGASGFTGWTAPFEIPYIPPGNETPPDLMCTLEPVSIADSDTTTPGLQPGSSIEQWELSITNIGGDLTLSGTSSQQLAQYLCLIGLFNAYENDTDTSVYAVPGYAFRILTTSNLNLTTGETITKILDGKVTCAEDGEIGAWSFLNLGALLSTSCGLYEFEELDWGNNNCSWSAPCVEGPGTEDENCTIHPSAYYNGEEGGEYDFSLTCDPGDEECEGTVGWEITAGGTITGNQTDATATVESNDSTLEITATVDNPDGEDAICYAHIYFTPGGEDGDNGCYIFDTPQPGYPGSSHWFNLRCTGEGIDEDETCPNGVWSVLPNGEDYLVPGSYHGDWAHWEGQLNNFAINTNITIEANVDFGGAIGNKICRARIEVPEIPCIDYV